MPRVSYDTSFDEQGSVWYTVVRHRIKPSQRVQSQPKGEDELNFRYTNDLNPFTHLEKMGETYRVECCKKLGIHPHMSNHMEFDPTSITFQSPFIHQDWNPVIKSSTRDDSGQSIQMNPRVAMRKRTAIKHAMIERNAEEGLLKLESSGRKLGKLIEQHRNRLGMCQEELAQELSVPQRVVSELEKGTALAETSRPIIKRMNSVFATNLFSELKAQST